MNLLLSHRPILPGLGALGLALLLGGCPPPATPGGEVEPGPEPATHSATEVLVTVNGMAITEDDLQSAIQSNPRARGRRLSEEERSHLLEVIVQQEVLAQRATELKLDAVPHVHRQLAAKRAELGALRRKLLSRQLAAHLGQEEITVTDAQVRTYFEENEAQVAHRFHVLQILRRRPEDAAALRARLDEGEAFEALAAEEFSDGQAGARKPWDLGPMRWTQLPDPWRPVLAKMKPGEISPVISTDRRHWILKLVATQKDPEATFEVLQPTLRTALLRTRTEAHRRARETALRAAAEVVFSSEIQ